MLPSNRHFRFEAVVSLFRILLHHFVPVVTNSEAPKFVFSVPASEPSHVAFPPPSTSFLSPSPPDVSLFFGDRVQVLLPLESHWGRPLPVKNTCWLIRDTSTSVIPPNCDISENRECVFISLQKAPVMVFSPQSLNSMTVGRWMNRYIQEFC